MFFNTCADYLQQATSRKSGRVISLASADDAGFFAVPAPAPAVRNDGAVADVVDRVPFSPSSDKASQGPRGA